MAGCVANRLMVKDDDHLIPFQYYQGINLEPPYGSGIFNSLVRGLINFSLRCILFFAGFQKISPAAEFGRGFFQNFTSAVQFGLGEVQNSEVNID